MSDTTELLDSVRDIHEPLPPESSSALVLGLLALVFLVFTTTGIVYLARRRSKVNRELQRELQAIQYDKPDTALVKIAVLLRRAMHHVHGEKINQLEDQPWLEALNNTFNTNYFTHGDGQIFGSTLYAEKNEQNTDTRALCSDISKLIAKTRIIKSS